MVARRRRSGHVRAPRRPNVVALAAAACLAAFGGCRDGGSMSADETAMAGSPSQAWSRVIVGFRVDGSGQGETPRPVAPPRTSDAGTDAERRAAIAAARERLLATLPQGEFRLTRAYDVIPFVALEVSPAGLAALRASPLVAGIEDDRAVGIPGGPASGAAGGEPTPR
jgi:hypothetical protein